MYKSKLDVRDYSPNKPMCLLNAKDAIKEYSLLTDGNGNRLPTKERVDDEMLQILGSYMSNVGFKSVIVRGYQIFGLAPVYLNKESYALHKELSIYLNENTK